ncbi:MAG: N-acyl homoserine lactone hydrolase [Gaiellaceae bacterium]|nr:N-acyl homoserine lactone hydrolase [Gaiellaceae bacterium]
MRVRRFSTGRVRRKRAPSGVRRYFSQDWGDETLPVNVFLVEHPQGLCLFDTGQTARAARPGYFPSWYPFFRLSRFELTAEEEIDSQLVAAGYAVGDVRWVVLSHLHTDHVGGVDAFSSAEVLVSQTEWKRAQGLEGRLRGYLPQYWPQEVAPDSVAFAGPAVGPFPHSHDIVGDGSLVLVPTPGHTAGHMSLLVSDGSRSYLLGGDVAMSGEDLAGTAPQIAEFCAQEGIAFLASHDDGASELLAPKTTEAPREGPL